LKHLNVKIPEFETLQKMVKYSLFMTNHLKIIIRSL